MIMNQIRACLCMQSTNYKWYYQCISYIQYLQYDGCPFIMHIWQELFDILITQIWIINVYYQTLLGLRCSHLQTRETYRFPISHKCFFWLIGLHQCNLGRYISRYMSSPDHNLRRIPGVFFFFLQYRVCMFALRIIVLMTFQRVAPTITTWTSWT